ncbi:MAG TPA: hypothetical protein VEQ41_07545 [Solirubrobacterales bacterium]|nr:hypothetical protein [Solirubrobacterales bacterium]
MTALAFAAPSALAEVRGHFTSEASSTTITGAPSAGSSVKFSFNGGTPIECTKITYTAVMPAPTTNVKTLVPHYTECRTEGSGPHNVTITTKGCDFTIFSAPALSQATAAMDCPSGVSGMAFHHPNCTISVPAQSFGGGVSYGTTTEFGKHAITVATSIGSITAHYESGICVFLGTKHTGAMSGSLTLRGANASGEAVGITVT